MVEADIRVDGVGNSSGNLIYGLIGILVLPFAFVIAMFVFMSEASGLQVRT